MINIEPAHLASSEQDIYTSLELVLLLDRRVNLLSHASDELRISLFLVWQTGCTILPTCILEPALISEFLRVSSSTAGTIVVLIATLDCKFLSESFSKGG